MSPSIWTGRRAGQVAAARCLEQSVSIEQGSGHADSTRIAGPHCAHHLDYRKAGNGDFLLWATQGGAIVAALGSQLDEYCLGAPI